MDVDPSTSALPPLDQNEDQENTRVGYQMAVSLATYEGNLVWARYGLMLLAQTIILTGVGLASTATEPARALIWIGLSVIGLVLCALWWTLNDVGFRYFFHWIFAAGELEERYLHPVRSISRAFPIDRDEAGPIMFGGKPVGVRILKQDRIRIVHASKGIIAIFGLLYVVLLGVFLFRLTR